MARERRRPERYRPWEREPEPEAKTKREQAARATTWEEWEAAQPLNGVVLPLPLALDWQRGGLVPPGFLMVRCLCFVTLCRPATWQGLAWNSTHRHPIRPSFTVGDRCPQCGAPYQRIAHRDDPYVIDLELPEQEGWREYWAARGLLDWAAGRNIPVPPEA